MKNLFLMLVAALSWVIPGFADAPSIGVCTYNIRYASPNDGQDVWPNRVDTVADFVKQFDVIGLQEVTLAQLDDLRIRLPEFEFYGVGRDDGKSGGEHAPILFRKDRLTDEGHGTIWLSNNPEQVGVKGWDAALPRTLTWMLLKDSKTSAPWWIANTHFDHKGAEARENSGKLVADFAREQAGNIPCVVMGDFNCMPGSAPYKAIEKQLQDARSISMASPTGPNSTWNGFDAIVAGRVIDHIFVGKRVVVSDHAIMNPNTPTDRFGSDHLPVVATVFAE